jgi:short-subunit dehydrogenase
VNVNAKHAVVVGGSSGLGEAIGRALRASGHFVTNLSRRPAPADAADLSIACDVTDDASVETAVSEVLEARDAPDVVVYAAGMPAMGKTLAVPVAEARRAFEVNLWGFDRVIRAVLPAMERHGTGSILYLSSLAALRAIPHEAYYAASKAAAVRYAGSLAHEAARSGVSVKVLHIGFVPTGFFAKEGWYGMPVPEVQGSGVAPADVARAAVALLASDAPSSVLGWRERLISLGDRIAPNLYDRVLMRRARGS